MRLGETHGGDIGSYARGVRGGVERGGEAGGSLYAAVDEEGDSESKEKRVLREG